MITAIVVARGGSVRLPNKALLPFSGSTLIGHKVKTLKNCRRIGRVVVGSDSPDILLEASAHGAEIIQRKDYFCDETRCTANEMIVDMAEQVMDDVIVWAHPTNPLVKSETYDDAIDAYERALTRGFDSLASVRQEHRHAWWLGNPLNHDPYCGTHLPAAKLDPVSYQDGAIFIQTRSQMFMNRSFYGKNPFLFPVAWDEGWDIDTARDLEVARALDQSSRNAPVVTADSNLATASG